MILDTWRGRVWSERRFFQLDRLNRFLSFFSEQLGESSVTGSAVAVGTGGDTAPEVDVGLPVPDDEMFGLAPSPSPPPPPEDATSLAMGPPGKVYSAPESKT